MKAQRQRHGDLDIMREFTDMFERIQIKTFSEAVCETIGSIMKIAKGKGRNCDPINFSKEIILSYNLPPLHVLSQEFIPVIVKELSSHKEYFRRGHVSQCSWYVDKFYTIHFIMQFAEK